MSVLGVYVYVYVLYLYILFIYCNAKKYLVSYYIICKGVGQNIVGGVQFWEGDMYVYMYLYLSGYGC